MGLFNHKKKSGEKPGPYAVKSGNEALERKGIISPSSRGNGAFTTAAKVHNGRIKKGKTEANGEMDDFYLKRLYLNTPNDYLLLQNELEKGNLVIVDYKNLLIESKESGAILRTLKSQINTIKRYCLQHNGSILPLREGLILITPDERFVIN